MLSQLRNTAVPSHPCNAAVSSTHNLHNSSSPVMCLCLTISPPFSYNSTALQRALLRFACVPSPPSAMTRPYPGLLLPGCLSKSEDRRIAPPPPTPSPPAPPLFRQKMPQKRFLSCFVTLVRIVPSLHIHSFLSLRSPDGHLTAFRAKALCRSYLAVSSRARHALTHGGILACLCPRATHGGSGPGFCLCFEAGGELHSSLFLSELSVVYKTSSTEVNCMFK